MPSLAISATCRDRVRRTLATISRMVFQGIYFVECEGFIKIGWARNVVRRFYELETGNPYRLIPVAFIAVPDASQLAKTERAWHVRFAVLRERGEWFRAAPILRDAITLGASQWPTLARPRCLWWTNPSTSRTSRARSAGNLTARS
jgi:hypothetical protein